MAMSVSYTTFNGMIVHENRGGVERAYVPDTLGSTQALIDDTETVTDTWEYWPYGEVSQRTGTNPTPFTFVGTLGYFKDLLDRLLYVRARYLRVDLARWVAVDPLWPHERAYAYVRNAPLGRVDPTGLQCSSPSGCTPCTDKIKPGVYLDKPAKNLLNCLAKATDRPSMERCFEEFGSGVSDQAWDSLKDYMACSVASVLARRNGVPLQPGCDPCSSGLVAPDTQWCCYAKFLKCLFDCLGKTGYQFGNCVVGCEYSKKGFINCGFAEAM